MELLRIDPYDPPARINLVYNDGSLLKLFMWDQLYGFASAPEIRE